MNSTLERVSDAVLSLDDDYRYTYLNSQAEDLLDVAEEDVLGERVWDVFPGAVDTVAQERFEEAMESQEQVSYERYNADLGRWFEARVYPDEDGISVFFTDVTERKERERELERKTRAMEEAPVGITLAAPEEGNPMRYANDGFTEITGYSKSEVVGRNCNFLQGEATEEAPVDAMREAIDEKRAVTVEVRNYRKDGTEFWNEVKIAPVTDEEGGLTDFVGFQRDVTERVEARREVERQRDTLELLTRLMRHDVGNELQHILGDAELLRRNHVDEAGQERARRLVSAVENAAEIIQTSRDLAEGTIEGGDHEPVSLSGVLEDQIADLRSAASDAVVVTDGPIPEVDVLADEMLSSVFRNLLTNAVGHNDKPVPEVTVSVTATEDEACVRVADNGPGVPDDLKERAFEKGTMGVGGGTGIGLYLVGTFVDRYGGDVWIEDNDPEGAAFCVELQRA